jgi:hypothetical protein
MLFDRLDGHETHMRPAHRFTDCFGIVGVIFVALEVGFDCGAISLTV